jgi:hypothetical protein
LDQALKDLIESYAELDEETEEKFGDDEESYSHAVIEVLETSIESALEEHDISTTLFANILSNLTEALEQLDPAAFEDEEGASEYSIDDVDDSDDVEDIEDIDDLDEDELEIEDDDEDED